MLTREVQMFLWGIGLRPKPQGQGVDMETLARLADGHGVLTLNLFRERLESTGFWQPLLSTTSQQLREQALGQRAARLAFLQELTAQAGGRQVVVLKGLALEGAGLYAAGERWSMDLDILVRREDALFFHDLLIRLGFSPVASALRHRLHRTHESGYTRPEVGKIELHTAPMPQFDLPSFWEHITPFLLTEGIWMPDVVETFLLLAAHHYHHYVCEPTNYQLGGVWDIGRAPPQWGASFNWTEVAARARKHRSQAAVAAWLRFVKEEVEVNLPFDVEAAVAAFKGAKGISISLETIASQTARSRPEYSAPGPKWWPRSTFTQFFLRHWEESNHNVWLTAGLVVKGIWRSLSAIPDERGTEFARIGIDPNDPLRKLKWWPYRVRHLVSSALGRKR